MEGGLGSRGLVPLWRFDTQSTEPAEDAEFPIVGDDIPAIYSCLIKFANLISADAMNITAQE
ncbi:hypothetical protein C9418_24340 [Rhizobium sp. SEMIA 4032]|nr:hypothetical protein C9418_24340 [Rhizobium sp. SEMIA 4032]